MSVESDEQRRRREQRRARFDEIADRYDATRRGYPEAIVHFVLTTAGLRAGGRVLEVGCGTGQLTEQLARHDLDITAIDIGPAMAAAARRRVSDDAVRVEVVSFEDFDAEHASFDLVVSATAFHWVDPEVRFVKAARLLRDGGWLALLTTGERYDDPFGAILHEMWASRSPDGASWVAQQRPDTEHIAASGCFEPAVEQTHAERMQLPKDVVVGVETTRATYLSWDEATRRGFRDELRHHLQLQAEVDLTQQTTLSMARVLPRSS